MSGFMVSVKRYFLAVKALNPVDALKENLILVPKAYKVEEAKYANSKVVLDLV